MTSTTIGMLIAKRFITRLITLPSYLFILMPWAIVVFSLQNENLTYSFFRVIAFFAFKPDAQHLDGSDIVLAVSSLFFAINIIWELIEMFRGQHTRPFYRFEFRIKLWAGILGWSVLAVLLAIDGVEGGIGTSLLFLTITGGLIAVEYGALLFIDNAVPAYLKTKNTLHQRDKVVK